MAKVKFGAALADARGSVAGLTFTKNRFGQIARQKVSPVQPRSVRQNIVRASFQGLSTYWANTLTGPERAAWIALANINPLTNAFGDSIHLTGLQYFQRVNRNLQKVGVAKLVAAPANQDVTGLLTMTGALSAATQDLVITFTATPLAATHRLAIYATPPLTPGRNFAENLYKHIVSTSPAETSPYSVSTNYASRFGAVQVGQKIFVKVSVINHTNGAESSPLTDDLLVVA